MKKEAKSILNDYCLTKWRINPSEVLDVEYVEAKQFLRAERADLICKLIYIDSRIKNRNIDFATELYTEHIRAFSWGTFTEPGQEEKNSIEKYIETFDFLIENCKENGISADKSAVPISEDGIILDGSHRTAIAIYFNLRLPVVRIPNNTVLYDMEFFKHRGLKKEYLDYISFCGLQYFEPVFFLCLWPAALDIEKRNTADKLIKDSATVLYRSELELSYHAMEQVMIHAYGHQEWTGGFAKQFSGIPTKAKACFSEKMPMAIYVLCNSSIATMNELKSNIRALFGIHNHSVHITDTKDEAVILGQMLLNDNSVDAMIYGNPFANQRFIDKLLYFNGKLCDYSCNKDDYAIDSGAVLSIYGLRDTNDIDYITLFDDNLPTDERYENHLCYGYGVNTDNLIYDPRNYFYYFGLKFVTLDRVKHMKEARKAEKDYKDVKLIKKVEFRRFSDLDRGNKILFIRNRFRKQVEKHRTGRLLLKVYRQFRYRNV